MISYREFYIWLEGYLEGRLEDKNIPITPIVEKMSQVEDGTDFDIEKFKQLGRRPNPIVIREYKPNNNDGELGAPPKIVMWYD